MERPKTATEAALLRRNQFDFDNPPPRVNDFFQFNFGMSATEFAALSIDEQMRLAFGLKPNPLAPSIHQDPE